MVFLRSLGPFGKWEHFSFKSKVEVSKKPFELRLEMLETLKSYLIYYVSSQRHALHNPKRAISEVHNVRFLRFVCLIGHLDRMNICVPT